MRCLLHHITRDTSHIPEMTVAFSSMQFARFPRLSFDICFSVWMLLGMVSFWASARAVSCWSPSIFKGLFIHWFVLGHRCCQHTSLGVEGEKKHHTLSFHPWNRTVIPHYRPAPSSQLAETLPVPGILQYAGYLAAGMEAATIITLFNSNLIHNFSLSLAKVEKCPQHVRVSQKAVRVLPSSVPEIEHWSL